MGLGDLVFEPPEIWVSSTVDVSSPLREAAVGGPGTGWVSVPNDTHPSPTDTPNQKHVCIAFDLIT